MEFYLQLTKLLKKSNEIIELETKNNGNYDEMEENMKKFIEILKSFLKCQIQSEESNNFRIYFIEFLSEFIYVSFSFCSQNDQNEIIQLIKSIAKNMCDKNNNNNEDALRYKNDYIKNNMSKNYELSKNVHDDMNNNFNFNLNNIEKKNIFLNVRDDEKGFNSQNYRNKNSNDFPNFPIKNEIINYKKENNSIDFNKINTNTLNQDYVSNKCVKINTNNIFSNINSNSDFMTKNNNMILIDNFKNENNPRYFDINNKNTIQNNYNCFIINTHFNNNQYNQFNNNFSKENLYNKNDINNKILSYNYNNINTNINNKKNNNNQYENEHIYIKKDKNNNILENNNNTSSSSHPSNYNVNYNYNNNNNYNTNKEYNNYNKYINNIKEQNIYPEQNQNYKNKKNENKIMPNPSSKYQEKIDYYYQNVFKSNIPKVFIQLITGKNNSLNALCSKVFYLVEYNRIEYIEQEYKEELTTLICLLYYFAKGMRNIINEYIFRSNLDIDQKLFEFLRKNILIPDNSEILEFNPKKIKRFSNDFCKNLYLDNSQKGKNIIFSAYTFLTISRNLRKYCSQYSKLFFDELLEKEYLISFKIHFILKYQEYYHAISDDFIEVYHGLQFINKFYSEIFSENNNQNNRIIKNDEIGKYVFGKDRFILSFDKNSNFDVNDLFEEKDNNIFKEVFDKIQHFYSISEFNPIDINDLINYSTNKFGNNESNFILFVAEHVCEKNEFIHKNFQKYKSNLKKIEEQIFYLGKKTININKYKTIIDRFSINDMQKYVFTSLLKFIDKNIDPFYIGKYNLYPYGSITEFLGGKTSDIDIYLDIRQIKNNRDKIYFLYHLRKILGNAIGYLPKLVISTRLCVLTFKYNCNLGKPIDFDISLMGLCPYLHSVLIREYALMDSRFSLLAIILKKFIEFIGIKNQDNKNDFLNSFSWMILLITFLQDIIKPQILPKVLSSEYNCNIFYQIAYGNNPKNKTIESFVENIKEEETIIPDSLFDKKSLIYIYKEQISKKNDLTCAELFLYFLEFIIFYFKSDSVYVNCSIENEGYESMNCILNNNVHIRDVRFSEYFKTKYCKFMNFGDETITRDGLILIRDPIDPHYNPAQTLKTGSYKTFVDNLKKGYLELLKNGDFLGLRNKFSQN